MREFFKDKPVFAWALYDWANSAFATTVMAGFFPVFFQKFWSTGVASTETTSRLGYANAAAGFAIALLAPVLGAIGDRGGRRKQFLMAWTLLGVGATFSLYFVGQGQWFPAALLFVLGTMGFNGGIVFNDSLLLDVAKPADLDRVSAFGYALGYLQLEDYGDRVPLILGPDNSDADVRRRLRVRLARARDVTSA